MSKSAVIVWVVLASVLAMGLGAWRLTHPVHRKIAPLLPGLTHSNKVATAGAATPRPGFRPAVARDLAAYRRQYPTRLTRRGPSPASWHDDQMLIVPPEARAVTYPSAGRQLAAWVSSDVPPSGRLRPAVVYCHGGFWFGTDDWDATRPFRDAGFVVMTPTVRGENGNGGDFEYLWGEADDAVAAGRWLAAQPGVDPARVFVSGHSAGGTLAVLAVMTDDTPFAMAAPIGPSLDARWAAHAQRQADRDLVVFDPTVEAETVGRSPAWFTASLRRPVRLYQGDHDGSGASPRQFVDLARHFGKDATVFVVPGTHLASQASAVPRIAELFRGYTPPN